MGFNCCQKHLLFPVFKRSLLLIIWISWALMIKWLNSDPCWTQRVKSTMLDLKSAICTNCYHLKGPKPILFTPAKCHNRLYWKQSTFPYPLIYTYYAALFPSGRCCSGPPRSNKGVKYNSQNKSPVYCQTNFAHTSKQAVIKQKSLTKTKETEAVLFGLTPPYKQTSYGTAKVHTLNLLECSEFNGVLHFLFCFYTFF